MSASTVARAPERPWERASALTDVDATSTSAPRPDDWPHTSRILPWGVAAFVVMLFLVPFDAIDLPIALPVDATLDRFALLGLGGMWILALFAGGPAAPRLRRSPVNWGIFAFVGVTALTIAVHGQLLTDAEELGLAVKKLFLFLAFVLFFLIVSSSLRPSEVPRFAVLIVALASITAIGTIWEFRQGTNYFYYFAHKIFGHLAVVLPEPADPKYGRANVTGPTAHGLADTLLMAMALPLAVVGFLEAGRARTKWLYASATGLVLIGCFATLRKTGVVAPAAAVAVIAAYAPRRTVRLVPLLLVLVIVSQIVSPGALTGLRYQFEGGSRGSNQGRTDDYAAVKPDLEKHLALGRGFGSYDPQVYRVKRYERRRHRTFDNEYLLLAVETGVLGVAAFIGMLIAAWAASHRSARDSSLSRAAPAIASVAGIACFGIGAALFDVLAFPQAPYMLFLLCALAVVNADQEARGKQRSRWPAVGRAT